MQINQPQPLETIQTELGNFPSTQFPATLFPVRLETRFTVEADKIYLCIRIYPDDIQIDTHEPRLTPDEEQWGKHLWEQVWLSGHNRAMEQALQDELSDRFGPGRAAWIAETLKPLNPEDRSDQPHHLPIKPIYPDIETRPDTWTTPPQIRALPERWVLFAYPNRSSETLTVLSNPVNPDLTAGFDPQDPNPNTTEGQRLLELRDDETQLPLDQRMKWLVDFKTAVEMGMGFRIELDSPQTAEDGFRRLVVLGLSTQSPPLKTAQTLESLLTAQRYTDSLDFVPQGLPSNNTEGSQAGYSATEPEQTTAFIRRTNATPPLADCNCHIAAQALGITAETFAGLPHTLDREQADAQSMNAALWPASWGYFFRYIIGHSYGHLTDDTLEKLRTHFIRFVRARGPIPALRVGQQPYGILPVTSLGLYKPNPNQKSEVFDNIGLSFLRKLRDRWQQCLPHIPRVEPKATSDELASTLANILGMQAVSETVQGRMAIDGILYGSPQPQGLSVTPDPDLTQKRSQIDSILNRLLGDLHDQNVQVPATSFVFTEAIFKLTHTDRDFESKTFVDLLNRIRTADVSSLSNGFLSEVEQQNPLALILRHSMLMAYLDTAYHLNLAQGLIDRETHKDPALIGILTDPATHQVETTPTLFQLLDRPLSDFDLGNEDALREVIHTFDSSRHPSAKVIEDVHQSLEHLATVTDGALQDLLNETLDLASHRLDAWITSLATARLSHLRQQQPEGLILGGYGWVENLKLSGTHSDGFGDRTLVEAVPEQEDGPPLYENAQNGGYTLAPSIQQATTAAILRSGYLNHKDQGATAPFAIDLSSDRVRLAQWILEGVRQGQSLGVLLGYRFERGLQEVGLGRYILPFRRLVPFSALLQDADLNEAEFLDLYREAYLTPETVTRSAIESAEAQHVVDGLALARIYQAEQLVFGSGANEVNVANSHRSGVEAQLDQLTATLDAVGDLITAESVYQLAQGNELLAGGTLDSVARGEAPPPDPDVIRTPRSGIAHTHRIPIIFDGTLQPSEQWSTNNLQQRALLEPHLNHWLGELWGSPTQFRIEFTFWDRATDTPIRAAEPKRLSDFLLSPLDIVALASINETGTGSPLEAWMTYEILRSRPEDIPVDAIIRFSYDRASDWDASDLSLGTLMELARTARELVTTARPLDARDLASPEQETSPNFETADLHQRAQTLINAFSTVQTSLETIIADSHTDSFNLDILRQALLQVFFLGISEAVPQAAQDHEPNAKPVLQAQARSILDEMKRRSAVLDDLAETINQSEERDAIKLNTQRIQVILGKDFPILPKFSIENAEELLTTYGDSFSLQNQDDLAAITWLGQMAHVRDGCDRLNTCLTYAEILNSGFDSQLTVGQLPSESGDRWIGLPDNPTRPNLEPKVGLMTLAPHDFALNAPISGLMVDEWVETVPNAQEIAAAAFNFDAPQAQPPHSILLAVPPGNAEQWDIATLAAIVEETLDLAKLRTVDNAALFHSAARGAFNEHGHFLPALYFAFNPDVHSGADMTATVSTDFATAAEITSESFPPRITEITPLLAVRGQSTLITLRGDNLAEASEVIATSAASIDPPTIINNSEIRVRVTFGGTSGFALFNILTPNGAVESDPNQFVFEIKDRAILTSISPISIQKGKSVDATIRGNHLEEASSVSFTGSGLQVSNLTLGQTTIQCRITASSSAASGKRQLKVTTPAGTVTSAFDLEVKNPPPRPTISSITPKIFVRGQSEMRFTIRGSNLLGATTVTFFNSRGSGPTIGIGSRIVSVRSSTEIDGRISVARTTREEKYQFRVHFGSTSVSNSSLSIEVIDLGEPLPPKPKPSDPFPRPPQPL